MKNIVVCIGNGLLSEAIMNMLRSSGEFKPFRLLVQKKSHIASDCEAVAADILLMDVSYASGTTMETRLKEVKQVREKIPPCKLVMLCDENAAPHIAREVSNAKMNLVWQPKNSKRRTNLCTQKRKCDCSAFCCAS